ncbi:MATE family efflux transporter [Pseudohaliea rubra]|uniref:Multidrug-efflux transporter n=1 Tax=Pseudohaliea rubra DSM 19751 TaxID=1265313 RepID=A0A095VN51_9GAMM|nr:MATE family efflux transporter [Pseudohaliea rubra]KGE02907.1 Multidrug and toxin extrusion (MATE) family efflux pump YdhE/NorM,-like protein [Pseudohaliea rubra DSM 19751]
MFSFATLRELFRLALPMVVSQGAFALMMFADRFFLSRIDATHVAASLGGGVTFFLTVCFFNGILSYGNALVAQYYGQRQLERCPRVVTQGALIALGSQPLILLAALLLGDLFLWMGHEPALAELERRYFLTLLAGAFLFLLKNALASYFSGIGRTRVVMICDVTGVCLNIPLSYLFIFGKLGLPALGIAGAALGTVIAGAFTIGLYALFYFNAVHAAQFRVYESFRYDARILRRFLRLGFPSGLEVFIGVGTFNLFLLLYQSYGVAEGAAMAIVFNWDMLSFVPLMGLNIAVMSLIGRYVGARDLSRATQVISAGLLLGLGYSGVLALCFLLFRVPLLEVFATPGADFAPILAIGQPMMVGMACYVMADAVILVCGGTLRGAGDTRWMMGTSIVVHLVMLALQFWLILGLAVSPLVSWWGFVATLIVNAVLYGWRVVGGYWRHPDRLARALAE